MHQRAKEDANRYDAEHNALMDDDYEVLTKKRINWDNIADEFVSNNDRLNLRRLQGSEKEQELLAPDADMKGIFEDEEEAQSVARSFLKVLELRTPDQLKYILLLLSSIVRNDPRRGRTFLALHEQQNGNGMAKNGLISSFSRVWLRDDIGQFSRGKAAIIAASILRWSEGYCLDYASLCNFVLSEFNKCKNDQLMSPLLALKGVVRNGEFQRVFVGEGGISKLAHILFENDNHRQVIYLCVYNLWALTFAHGGDAKESALLARLVRGQLIEKLVHFVKAKMSLKITRVTLALFENLVGADKFNEMVVLFGLFPVLSAMESDKKEQAAMEDEELKKSVRSLLDSLEKSVISLSSFERYEQEIRAEKLLWGPCHNSSFWKKYNKKLEEDNYKLIRELIALLSSEDPQTVAVACYDIGEWSRFYPDAKGVIEKLKGKYKLMSLIDHFDAEVKQHALNAVQKVLVKNWKQDEPHHTDANK